MVLRNRRGFGRRLEYHPKRVGSGLGHRQIHPEDRRQEQILGQIHRGRRKSVKKINANGDYYFVSFLLHFFIIEQIHHNHTDHHVNLVLITVPPIN